MKERFCLFCNKYLVGRWKQKFCSNKCQADFRYKLFLSRWITNKEKIVTKNISGHIKRYLLENYGELCSLCSWSCKNKITNKVPLEVDHIDGDAENNNKSNLRLLCPNCHSLTPFFRNLNKGNGRKWRRESNYYNTPLSLKNKVK